MSVERGDHPGNWFRAGGQNYARFRPEYPPALAAFLASASPDTRFAVDVGCGSGQLAAQLGAYFDSVLGLDPSADQIVHAPVTERVRYAQAPAEHLPVPDRSASLVAAAQAAHWFDLPAFYAEVRRIAREGALLALISYGVPKLDEALDEHFLHFYRDEIGPFWPPERQMVDRGYADLDFPFAEFPPPAMAIRKAWSLAELMGYISTWSAVKHAVKQGHGRVIECFVTNLAARWGDPATKRPVTWPINMRTGIV
ncbi:MULTISPECIES: class I SAM-dependent methyltransferase [Rhodanobacter]|uniref:class I SAM-dependent methyltransferase n=1 Tax=Rhodanobacter TaxID=75309 RepID=UPI0003F583E6|nr:MULTISPECIES: class I SAM-dependent methyltransferase [Rhodanobacter]TAN18660.1 MAG: class I SAM-dependent methyltransferase [Rhodanobacter sp.]UJJ54404.1 class I SAM-dependent methyltransferase [Rhodanobacter thiooxydans]